MKPIARSCLLSALSDLTRHRIAPIILRSSVVRSVVHNRELIFRLTRREITLRFRGSILGIAWAVIAPLLMALTYTFVLSMIFKSRWSGLPNAGRFDFVIMLLTGIAVYNIFAECVVRAPTLVIANPSYVTRVRFPLEILPVVMALSASVNAIIALAIALLLNLVLRGQLHLTVIFLPILLLPYVIFVVSGILVLSAIGVYLRDLSQLVALLTTLMLFLTPIFYPITAVPAAFRRFMWLNPLTFIVEQARSVLIFGNLPDFVGIAVYALVAIVALIAGHWLFCRLRLGFADVL